MVCYVTPSTHQTLGSVMLTLQLGLSLLETQASSLIVYTPNPGVCYVSPCDFATWTISSGNISFFSYCLHTKPWGLLCFPPVTLQLGLSLLETQASSLIVYTPNPGVCYVSPCDFATWTISSGNTSFFSYLFLLYPSDASHQEISMKHSFRTSRSTHRPLTIIV